VERGLVVRKGGPVGGASVEEVKIHPAAKKAARMGHSASSMARKEQRQDCKSPICSDSIDGSH